MTLPVSLCILRIELSKDVGQYRNNVTEESVTWGAMASERRKSHIPKIPRGRREMKDISVETYSNDPGNCHSLGLQSTSNVSNSEDKQPRKPCEKQNADQESRTDQIAFVSGNPFVEVTKGILHLFKENELTNMEQAAQRSQTVCILAVPATVTCHDLLMFTAACHGDIQHLRIVRDGSPNQYMALLTFRSQQSAVEFYKSFNGAPFNLMEPECCCHLVFVSHVELLREDDDGAVPPQGHTELPTCPVCLERMDESVDGILTILCNHSFHGNCLAKWGDTSCPVCRYVQTPELVADNRCLECHSADSLWICLICGHVGCGRYVHGHAFQHYQQTSHCYAMQLGNNRVWDYVGDNFVHRLLQNKGDGKLVEGHAPGKEEQEEKLDSVQLEFTYLLTSQLDSQRLYFEEKMALMEQQTLIETADLKDKASKILNENEKLQSKLANLSRDKQTLEKKLQQVTSRLTTTQAELQDERQLCRSLRQNQSEWQVKFTSLENQFAEYKDTKDKELLDVRDQLRDVMFYLEAQKQIAESADKDEIAQGQIVIGDAPQPSHSGKPRRRRKQR